MKALARLRYIGQLAAISGTRGLARFAPVLPKTVDENGGDRQFLDQAFALLVAVHPFGEIVINGLENGASIEEDPVRARVPRRTAAAVL